MAVTRYASLQDDAIGNNPRPVIFEQLSLDFGVQGNVLQAEVPHWTGDPRRIDPAWRCGWSEYEMCYDHLEEVRQIMELRSSSYSDAVDEHLLHLSGFPD